MGRGGSRPTRDVPGPVPGGRAGTRWAGRWGGGRSHVDFTCQLWQVESWVEGKGVLQAGLRGAGASRGGQAASCVQCPREADVEGASSAASPATPDSGGRLGLVIAGVLPEGGMAGEGKGSRRRRSQWQLGSAGPDISPCRKPGRGRTCGCGSEAPFGGTEQGGCEDERCGVEISEVLPCLIVMEGFVFGRVSGRS